MAAAEKSLTLGEAIRSLRRASGLSQRELATRISVDPTYVSHLEADRREPSLALVKEIARALDVPSGLILAVALWMDLPQEEKDRYSTVIQELIETAEAAQFVLFDRRHRTGDAD